MKAAQTLPSGRTIARALSRWRALRLGFAGAAALFAFQGFARYDQSAANFDESVAWYAVALVCVALFCWDEGPAGARLWPGRFVAFAREHWLEGLALAAIVGIALFLRLYRWGDYPPSDLICCAEDEIGKTTYEVVEGDRPLVFPLIKYTTALGFIIWGENTTALRVPPLVFGVLSVVPFYILLRQMVSVPAALFATVLFATSRLFFDVTARHQPTALEAILVALFLVRGIKTGSPLMFAGLGLVAGLISYEYEGYKPVAIFALGYIAAACVAFLFWPPSGWRKLWERSRSLGQRAWRPAIAFLLAAGIAIGPMLVGLIDGRDLYFRQANTYRAQREAQGVSAYIPDDWRDRLEWATQQFLPYDAYAGSGNLDPYFAPPENRPLTDYVSGTLLFAALAWGVVTVWRPFRLFFAVWFIASLAGGALAIPDLNPSRIIGAIVPGFVLIALLVDDVHRAVLRVQIRGPAVRRLAAALLVAAACYAVYWNASTFNAIADDSANQVAFYEIRGQNYFFCSYLREQGVENYSIALQSVSPVLGFHRAHDTPEEEVDAWGDFRFVCHDLEGQNPIALEESWPVAAPSTRRVTLASHGPLSPPEEIDAALQRVYPELGPPDTQLPEGDDGGFTFIAYEDIEPALFNTRGLWADYFTANSQAPEISRVDAASEMRWPDGEPPVDGPLRARWRGVVRVIEGGSYSLQALAGAEVRVALDGEIVYSTDPDAEREAFLDLIPGWHAVEITLEQNEPAAGPRLYWRSPDGATDDVHNSNLFPLTSLEGWLHSRTIEVDGRDTIHLHRFDFTPHYGSAIALAYDAQAATGRASTPTLDDWRTGWTVDETRSYKFTLEGRSGPSVLILDGLQVLSVDAGEESLATGERTLRVDAGRHELRIVQRMQGEGAWTGVRLQIDDPSDAGWRPALSPF